MPLKVLLFPGGSQVSQEIYDSLKYEKKNIEVYATGADENNYATLYFENYIPGCPMISNPEETADFLKGVIETNKIDFLFPTFDPVFPFLQKYKTHLPCQILLPSERAVDICNSKKKTYTLFQEEFRVPKQYTKEEFTLPVYVKPEIGYGSRNHRLIKDQAELETIDTSEFLLLEYLEGREFTVDCFTNKENQLLFWSARERLRTVNGLAVTSQTVNLPEVEHMATVISTRLQMRGAWFFQVKYTGEGELCLLEIACRIPGSMCTSRMKGVNFPLLTILDRMDENLSSVLTKPYSIKSFKIYKTYYKTDLPYFSTVYCDLDDTLILNNKVNIDLMRLLYKFKNETKTLILLTRNKDAKQVLDTWKIGIFDEILIVPTREQKKSQYITVEPSIFIDDSYSERLDVSQNTNCIVFAPSEIELFN